MELFAFTFREGFTAWADKLEWVVCCSPSHFEKVSQLIKNNDDVIFGCSPSHFEKVSQRASRRSISSLAVRLRISRRFHSSWEDMEWSIYAVRLRISRRFHSIEKSGSSSMGCSPSHFEKVSQQKEFYTTVSLAVRLHISRRFHSVQRGA